MSERDDSLFSAAQRSKLKQKQDKWLERWETGNDDKCQSVINMKPSESIHGITYHGTLMPNEDNGKWKCFISQRDSWQSEKLGIPRLIRPSPGGKGERFDLESETEEGAKIEVMSVIEYIESRQATKQPMLALEPEKPPEKPSQDTSTIFCTECHQSLEGSVTTNAGNKHAVSKLCIQALLKEIDRLRGRA